MDAQVLMDFLRDINITQLGATALMLYFFYSRLDEKIKGVEERLNVKMDRLEGRMDRLEGRIDRLEDRMDKLVEKVDDIDRRLCRIEGSLATHGHCLFNQVPHERRVE